MPDIFVVALESKRQEDMKTKGEAEDSGGEARAPMVLDLGHLKRLKVWMKHGLGGLEAWSLPRPCGAFVRKTFSLAHSPVSPIHALSSRIKNRMTQRLMSSQ